MASQDDWVEDVRRWYYGGHAPASDNTPVEVQPDAGDPPALGYETALPVLQSRYWPDGPETPPAPR